MRKSKSIKSQEILMGSRNNINVMSKYKQSPISKLLANSKLNFSRIDDVDVEISIPPSHFILPAVAFFTL
jgi:hypothetical protein